VRFAKFLLSSRPPLKEIILGVLIRAVARTEWAGFGRTGLLKTGFNTIRFHSVWVTSKTGLNRVITRVNKKQMD
jgi:hypothetical protein